MFTPAIKYGIRIGLIVVITASILALLVGIQIPAIDYSIITQALGMPLAVMNHYIPFATVLINFVFVLTGFRLALLAWRFASIAIKWIWKVNE